MPEVVLQGSRVMPVVGEFEPAGVPQHVRVHAERHLGGLPEPRDHTAEANRAHGRFPLTHEDVSAWRLLALEPTQGSQFGARQWVNRGNAVLEPRDVQPGMHEISLLPAQRAQFGRSQSVPEGQQDHGRIAMSVAILACRLHQPFDLSLREVLTDPVMVIWPTTTANCSFTVVGVRPCDTAFIGQIPSVCAQLVSQGTLKEQLSNAERGDEGTRTPHHRVLQGADAKSAMAPISFRQIQKTRIIHVSQVHLVPVGGSQ
jgi:hypothetical protein